MLFMNTSLARTLYQSFILTIWTEWKTSFLNQFSAANIRQSSTIRLEKLRQKPSQSIAEFARKFRELANQTGYNNTAKKEMFRLWLMPWIQELVDDAIAKLDNYNDFIQ